MSLLLRSLSRDFLRRLTSVYRHMKENPLKSILVVILVVRGCSQKTPVGFRESWSELGGGGERVDTIREKSISKKVGRATGFGPGRG